MAPQPFEEGAMRQAFRILVCLFTWHLFTFIVKCDKFTSLYLIDVFDFYTRPITPNWFVCDRCKWFFSSCWVPSCFCCCFFSPSVVNMVVLECWKPEHIICPLSVCDVFDFYHRTCHSQSSRRRLLQLVLLFFLIPVFFLLIFFSSL